MAPGPLLTVITFRARRARLLTRIADSRKLGDEIAFPPPHRRVMIGQPIEFQPLPRFDRRIVADLPLPIGFPNALERRQSLGKQLQQQKIHCEHHIIVDQAGDYIVTTQAARAP